MSVLPAQKYLRVIPGVTFDYPFQYLSAIEGSTTPISLADYTATWTLTYPRGITTYTNLSGFSLAGQIGLMLSQPGTMQLGGKVPTTTPIDNGVLFGGDFSDLSNGQIDLVLTASTTLDLPWTLATYLLTLTDAKGVIKPLLEGAIATV